MDTVRFAGEIPVSRSSLGDNMNDNTMICIVICTIGVLGIGGMLIESHQTNELKKELIRLEIAKLEAEGYGTNKVDVSTLER